ncbi:MAG TPA: ATP-binding cassette domain-containing protein, partial [Rhodospirillales bacterium]|nr:ATP-binding cassette domain-containing protein [Rhodospirillales bacterium]
PKQLSGGQRQRVAMGRCMVRNPKVFLFDEPLSNLDAKLRTTMRGEIKKLHKRVATTIIYVTHDQVEAMTLADRIVIMNDGHIEQIGTPDKVYEAPVSMFVAGFIGSPTMNFFPAELLKNGHSYWVKIGDNLTLPLGVAFNERYGDKEGLITVGVRPEGFEWAVDGAIAEIETVASEVDTLGSDTLVYFEFGGIEAVARLPPQYVREVGASVRLRLDESRLYLFNPNTGRRFDVDFINH